MLTDKYPFHTDPSVPVAGAGGLIQLTLEDFATDALCRGCPGLDRQVVIALLDFLTSTESRQQFQKQLIYLPALTSTRQQCFSQSVIFLKIKHKKDEQTWVTDTKHENDGFLAGNGLLFRRVSLHGLEQSPSCFMPVYNRANHTNEFGPGTYVTPNLAYAKRYAGIKGAILVFRSPDSRNFVTWEPGIHDWETACSP